MIKVLRSRERKRYKLIAMAERINDLTSQDIANMLAENDERRRQLIAAYKAKIQAEKANELSLKLLQGGALESVSSNSNSKSRTGHIHAVPRPENAHVLTPGSLDERLFEVIIKLPQTVEKLAGLIKEPAEKIDERLQQLEAEKIVGHFDIERRKPTKHKGVSTPVIERFYFWRPRAELEPRARRTIMTGLLMRKWWSNHELVEAAKARTAPEIRAVDNMVRTLRRAENIWHKQGEDGRWLYWIREDRGEPPKDMDGRDHGPKSIHARRAKLKASKK